MSVRVENLTKRYGDQKALDGISFQASAGTVLGLLGPNGAGKSTTMKILSGFIPQSSGSVTVGGYNVNTQSAELKKIIGYLPEHNPLYLDMYVKEALQFICRIHQISDSKRAIEHVIEQTDLGDEQHKIIRSLSKGFRQRVGLAQAILPDPQVLILDEPSSGLDPNQVLGIRKLIMEMGKTKTVILSTHIMQEVEAICGSVIIINNGRIVADDTLQGIKSSHGEQSLEQIFQKLTKPDTDKFVA